MPIPKQWSEEWERDCMKWRGKVLTGAHCHWCYDWDGLPIDETTPEYPCNCGATPDNNSLWKETKE